MKIFGPPPHREPYVLLLSGRQACEGASEPDRSEFGFGTEAFDASASLAPKQRLRETIPVAGNV